jgi:hypothetical protein
VGSSRSGTTLVGSRLNAHPRALVAHEFDAATVIAHGTTRERLLDAIIAGETEFACGGRRWNGAPYEVRGAGHGSWASPLVIGDKKAGGTMSRRM